MIFNSFEFLIFFPIVLFLHFVLPTKIRWIALLIASYYFYISWKYMDRYKRYLLKCFCALLSPLYTSITYVSVWKV